MIIENTVLWQTWRNKDFCWLIDPKYTPVQEVLDYLSIIKG